VEIHELARRLAAVAIAAVDPERLVREELDRRGHRFDAVLALGKAAAGLARGARAAWPAGTVAPRRLLVRPHSSPSLLDPGWEQATGGHPLPDRQSLVAGTRVLTWLAGIAPQESLLALVSGGASACLEVPAPGLALEDLAAAHRALLAAGLPIRAVNAVRKHLSAVKGGGALRATRGRVLALLLSDVPGDDPATIASGPFAADPTTFAEALAAVERLAVPEPVRRHLAAGARGEIPETVKPGDPALERLETVLVGGNRTAVEAVVTEARRRGLVAVDGELGGEAVHAARELVARGRALARALAGDGVALVLGGETAVTLTPGAGRGGRNGELALAAAREIAARELAADSPGGSELVLALATDGEDGSTRYAGALVDGGSWEAVRRAGLDPAAALERHDAYAALAKASEALLETGPTGTNVADLAFYLRLPSPS
jgi:glycerate-2-kinase